MEKCKKKRDSFKIYLSEDERREIDAYANRVGFKKVSNLIRDAILYLARDPSYDFIFDKGSLFHEDLKRIHIRKKFLEAIDQALDIFEDNNLIVQEDGDLHDDQP